MSLLTQEKVVENLDKLTTVTGNFPTLIHEAVEMAIINGSEKDVILHKYKSLCEKLTTFYLLAGSKGSATLAKLPELLESTGNLNAANVLLQNHPERTDRSANIDLDVRGQQIMTHLEKLCSHTENPGFVLSYATGMGLVTGIERDIMAQQCRSDEDQLKSFYALVATKGEAAFENLLQVLKLTNNWWALDVLHYKDESSS